MCDIVDYPYMCTSWLPIINCYYQLLFSIVLYCNYPCILYFTSEYVWHIM